MKIKFKTFGLVLIFLTVIIFLAFSLIKCIKANNVLKNALPYLLVGEKIDYFDVISVDDQSTETGETYLSDDKPSLILIFSRPCTPCDKNIIYWKKFSSILSDSVLIYGIILKDLSEAINFSKNARLNFPLYVPKELNKFIKKFRLKFKDSQTIVCVGKEIKYLKLGNISGEDAVKIIKFTRSLK
jgi:hypothetical protein